MICRSEHFDAGWYRKWAGTIAAGAKPVEEFGEDFARIYYKVWEAMQFGSDNTPVYRHRKMWEWCAIAEALDTAGLLQAGKRGCGFAVGQEPLTSLFAARNATIVATDLASGNDSWSASGQQATSASQIYWPGLIGPEAFEKRVRFLPVDMHDLTPLRGQRFDFMWSSCSFEHLGSLEAGLQFVEQSADLLAPGGIAVHTTEYNVSSNAETMEADWCVVYRKQDLIELSRRLPLRGARLRSLEFETGDSRFDCEPDIQPYYTTGRQHVKLILDNFVVTSILLVVEKDVKRSTPKADSERGDHMAKIHRFFRSLVSS